MLSSELNVPQVTILTPTWNRRHLLPRLYNSLVAQQAPHGSFEWLVVDDGSTDGTSNWLENLIPEAPFTIRVIRQKNGGKHRALNVAAKEIISPWFLILDSDDWLLSGAMELIISNTFGASPDVRAIISPREIEGRPPKNFVVLGGTIAFAEFMRQKRKVGDTSDIIRSEFLIRNLFPEFPNETFMAESYLYGGAFSDGGIKITNEKIMGAQYQVDGLSARSLQLRVNNPLGAIANYKAELNAGISGLLRIRSKINYYRFFFHAWISGKNPEICDCKKRVPWVIVGFLIFISDVLRLYSRIRYRSISS